MRKNYCGKILSNIAEFNATCKPKNVLEIFTVKRNIFSEISKVLLNDMFAEFNGSSRIKNIITDISNFSELQVDDISAKVTAESTKKFITIT